MILSILLVVLAQDGGSLDAGVKLGPCRDRQTICFSPLGRCHEVVIGVIDRAVSTLDIAIYSLNQPDIVDAIARAKARGVKVRMVLDSTQIASPKEVEQLKKLVGIPMKRDNHAGIMHLKTAVVDQKEFVTGSFNWTNNATANNNENLLAWECPKNAVLYQADFDRLWATFKDVDAGVP